MRKWNSVLSVFGLALLSRSAWAWFAEGHQIVAVIAADNQTPTARSHVSQILGVPADTGAVAKAMAAAFTGQTPSFERKTGPQDHGINRHLPTGQGNGYSGALP